MLCVCSYDIDMIHRWWWWVTSPHWRSQTTKSKLRNSTTSRLTYICSLTWKTIFHNGEQMLLHTFQLVNLNFFFFLDFSFINCVAELCRYFFLFPEQFFFVTHLKAETHRSQTCCREFKKRHNKPIKFQFFVFIEFLIELTRVVIQISGERSLRSA